MRYNMGNGFAGGNYMFKLIPEKKYEQMMRAVVEPGLAAMREEIDMPLSTGGTLHAEVYNRLDARRAVIILHGYTESAEKFREMAWYFVNDGYSVFAMDHRGHGRSVREVQDATVTHVESFDDYVRDLGEFMEKAVYPRMGNAPLYLYAHSMGGAIGALALIEHPDWFARAVLTAPMIAPVTKPLPGFAAWLLADVFCQMGRGRARAFVGKPFDPQSETFERSHDTSRARYDYYQNKRVNTSYLQNCAPTYSWIREGVGITRRLLDKKNAQKIRTPLLLCQAGLDSIVKLEPQNRFVRQVPGAQLKRFDTARHEIYASEDSVMRAYVSTVLNFLDGKGI